MSLIKGNNSLTQMGKVPFGAEYQIDSTCVPNHIQIDSNTDLNIHDSLTGDFEFHKRGNGCFADPATYKAVEDSFTGRVSGSRPIVKRIAGGLVKGSNSLSTMGAVDIGTMYQVDSTCIPHGSSSTDYRLDRRLAGDFSFSSRGNGCWANPENNETVQESFEGRVAGNRPIFVRNKIGTDALQTFCNANPDKTMCVNTPPTDESADPDVIIDSDDEDDGGDSDDTDKNTDSDDEEDSEESNIMVWVIGVLVAMGFLVLLMK